MSIATPTDKNFTAWNNLDIPIDREWEAAYQRFETPREEVAKFKSRLQYLGCQDWEPNGLVAELFCGRGNGLHALSELGFTNLAGVDLSAELLSAYEGPAQLFAGDCCELQFADNQCDVIIVQGGLHHLRSIPMDLDRCLREIRRVLKPAGYFCMVEPWQTPFLDFVHWMCDASVARRCWDKLDALAEMIEREIVTYEQWLNQPNLILATIKNHFQIQRQQIALGKIMLRAQPKKFLSH